VFLSSTPEAEARYSQKIRMLTHARAREKTVDRCQAKYGPAAQSAGEKRRLDRFKTGRRIDGIGRDCERMLAGDRKSMAVRPVWLPGDWLGSRQGCVGTDPLRRAAAALQRRDADDPANGHTLWLPWFFGWLLGGGDFLDATRWLRVRFLLGATARLLFFRRRFRRSVRTAASARLAVLRRAAAAHLLTTGMPRLRRRFGHWEPDGSDKVRQQRDAGAEPTPQRAPTQFFEMDGHTIQGTCRRDAVHCDL
jgi:hypothetical protein